MERRKWLAWAVGQEVADKIYDNIERSGNSEKQGRFIKGSFIWNNTKEGYEYWQSINSKIEAYLAERVDPQLKVFLIGNGLWYKFIDNFNPLRKQDSYDLGDSFRWKSSTEGYYFWSTLADKYSCYQSNAILSLTKKPNNDENQLQGKEDPRGEGDGSEGSRVCCEGDESGFRLSYTQRRKRIDFQKREVGDFK